MQAFRTLLGFQKPLPDPPLAPCDELDRRDHAERRWHDVMQTEATRRLEGVHESIAAKRAALEGLIEPKPAAVRRHGQHG